MTDSALRASLLIAMPQLQDPNFVRTVMIIVQHDESGTFGLVLNRSVDLTVQALCEGLEMKWGGDPEQVLHWGGPVQPNTGWMLFADDSRAAAFEDTAELTDGVYFAGSLEVLRVVSETPPGDVKLFLGYAGWGPGQIEAEMAQGVWLTAPASRDAVFHTPPDDLWEHAVRSLGIEPATLITTPGIH